MADLNESHKRRLVVTFEHVDKLLSEAYHHLDSAETTSPFQRYVPDSLPVQRKVIAAYMNRLSRMMEDVLRREGVPLPNPSVSAVWAYRTALMYARIAVEELAPKYMRGYGTLSSEAVRDLNSLTTELEAVLDQMNDFLAGGAGKDLQDRLRAHQDTVQEAEWLAVIDEVVTTHGLVEVRPMLSALVERIETRSLEIAVFGRVSSGKSSLLNHLLDTDALPVGVTPVTAVPTRVAYGPQAEFQVSFAQGLPVTAPIDRLRDYATEQGNPDNVRHITRIDVKLPIPWLEGIVFVDTPGLGSVSRNGELESLAYLPRCDIGILLIDAASTLSQEDTAVVHALLQSGAEAMVVLNKADLLSSSDRSTTLKYVREKLEADLDQDVPVYLVSVKGEDAELCDQWFRAALMPRLDSHRDEAQRALRRKVGVLRDTVILALERRLTRLDGKNGKPSSDSEYAKTMRNALAAIEAEWRTPLDVNASAMAESVLDTVAESLLAARKNQKNTKTDREGIGETVVSAAQVAAGDLAREVAGTIDVLRRRLSEALAQGTSEPGTRRRDGGDLPTSAMLPTPQFALPSSGSEVGVSIFITDYWLGGQRLQRRLKEQYGAWLTDATKRHIDDLRRWRSETLSDLRRAYVAEMEMRLALLDNGALESDAAALRRDLERLRHLPGESLEREAQHSADTTEG